MLRNIQDANPIEDDWKLLMTRTDIHLRASKNTTFNGATHLFATNEAIKVHNKKMLKALNSPVSLSIAVYSLSSNNNLVDEEQLEKHVLLCKGQCVMLTENIWIDTRLVNGALGEVVDNIYEPGCKPPSLPSYITVRFDNYSGPSWDEHDSKTIPIVPITLGSWRQLPLAMSWAITIHKSQGLTLYEATVYIGRTERQGMTFTAMSRVKTLNNIHIQPTFTLERYVKMRNNPYTIKQKKEESRLDQLAV